MRSWFVILVLASLSPACRRPTPAAPPPEQARLSPVDVKKDGAWLFTYVNPDGEFATTDKPDDVPPAARRLVRVIDPSKTALERQDTTNVYVLDLGELLKAGHAQARPLSREAFETGALAQLPPGQSSLRAERPAGDLGPPPDAGAGSAAGAVVTVYGTSWCPACREARRYLAGRGIPFVDKDVERDAAAARELADKGARLGVPTDRIPILDVRGRLLIGFDRARLEALLGAPT